MGDERLLDRPRAHQRRRRERQSHRRAPHRDEARLAFLDGPGGRRIVGFEPGMAAAERRVTRERQLRHGREDPQAIVGLGGAGPEDERRLGEVRPAGEALHLLGREAGAVQDDGDGVAAVGLAGEDVDLPERPPHRLSQTRLPDIASPQRLPRSPRPDRC